MKRAVISLLVVMGTAHCTTPAPPVAETPVAGPTPQTALRREYWPLDRDVATQDTVLPGPDHYRVRVVTTCLNDSAVVSSASDDAGPLLEVSHNYQSDLYVSRGAKPWLHQRLNKALLLGHPAAQRFAPAQEWSLSHTAFLTHKQGEFRFYTQLAVPDSDIFLEAEVALTPAQGVRIVSIRPHAESTEE